MKIHDLDQEVKIKTNDDYKIYVHFFQHLTSILNEKYTYKLKT